jgi:hypothetical protein
MNSATRTKEDSKMTSRIEMMFLEWLIKNNMQIDACDCGVPRGMDHRQDCAYERSLDHLWDLWREDVNGH